MWERRYRRDPNIIGRTIEVNNFLAKVAGVLPAGFRVYMGAGANVPPRIDVWFPAESTNSRAYHDYLTVARLRAGVTLQQAQAEMDAITARMVQQYPGAYPDGNFRIRLSPLHKDIVQPARTAILVLLVAVGFVLLIACANIANLMLARAAGRTKEIALRTALGAGRGRLIRQLLTESVFLSLAGGAAGLALARWGVDLLLYLRPQNLPRQEDIVLNGTVTAFTVGVSLLAGILSGLAPALHSSKSDVNSALKESGRSLTPGVAGSRSRSALIVAQVALSLVLLIGAGLMIRTFATMRDIDLGFDPSNVLTFRLEISPRLFRETEAKWRFYERAQEVLRAQPGVQSVSGITTVPLDPFELDGLYATAENPDNVQTALFNPVLPGYFETMRIPLVAGRALTALDNDTSAPVAVVDDRFAQQMWPGESPIGKRLFLRGQTKTRKEPTEIVGVARHVPYGGLRGDARAQIYVPYRNFTVIMTMVVRTIGDPMSLARALRKAGEELGGRRPVYWIKPMTSYVSDAMAETRFALALLGIMSVVAFILSVIGVYGVVSFSVAARMQEFAIRAALGAQPRDILKLSLGWSLGPVVAGIALGLLGSFALTRSLSTLLFGVSPTDPLTYVSVSAALFLAAVFACYIPIRNRTVLKCGEVVRG
jgi:putative ABC transport system permease protein